LNFDAVDSSNKYNEKEGENKKEKKNSLSLKKPPKNLPSFNSGKFSSNNINY
jgi:hypothetical protein